MTDTSYAGPPVGNIRTTVPSFTMSVVGEWAIQPFLDTHFHTKEVVTDWSQIHEK